MLVRSIFFVFSSDGFPIWAWWRFTFRIKSSSSSNRSRSSVIRSVVLLKHKIRKVLNGFWLDGALSQWGNDWESVSQSQRGLKFTWVRRNFLAFWIEKEYFDRVVCRNLVYHHPLSRHNYAFSHFDWINGFWDSLNYNNQVVRNQGRSTKP